MFQPDDPMPDDYQDRSIIITHFPMSPTVNHMLRPFRGRLVSSQMGSAFKAAVDLWAKLHMGSGGYSWQAVQLDKLIKEHQHIHVDIYFVFPRSKIISQKNQTKILDSQNRVKPAIDALFSVMRQDDKHIASSTEHKVIHQGETGSWTHFAIRPTSLLEESKIPHHLSQVIRASSTLDSRLMTWSESVKPRSRSKASVTGSSGSRSLPQKKFR